ncbi:MAG: SprB repeat-containing protein, partial [Prevotellaceae bacterium]|nr:SprB repeat-containing protein [Prevotellaceae bacterium]
MKTVYKEHFIFCYIMLFLGMINSGYAQTTDLEYTIEIEGTLYSPYHQAFSRVEAELQNHNTLYLGITQPTGSLHNTNIMKIKNTTNFSYSNKIVKLIIGSWEAAMDFEIPIFPDFYEGIYEQTYTSNIYPRLYGEICGCSGSLTVKIYPSKITLGYTSLFFGDKNILSYEHKINIFTNENYPSSSGFGWEYKIGGASGAWQRISYSGSKPFISICGQDLMSESDFNNVILNKQQIWVRLNYKYKQSENIIILDGMKSSPTITKAEVIPNLCAGESNAKVKLTFSEPLLENESLNIGFMNKHNQFELRMSTSNITSLDAGNTYTVTGLKDSTYTFGLLGKYPFDPNKPNDNTGTTYTGADGHKKTVKVTDPPELTLSLAGKSDVQCYGGADGTIRVNIGGGTAPYKLYYSGSGKTGTVQVAATGTHNITGLTAGTYAVELQDGNGCVPKANGQINEMTVSQPAQPVKIISASSENPTGYGRTNGRITVTAEGGTTPSGGGYTYEWQQNGQTLNILTRTAENLGSGEYRVKVSDSRGCYDTLTVILTEPAPLTVTVSTDSVIRCYGEHGRLRITVSGGVQPYKYSLNGGAYINFAANDASVAKTELLNAGAHTVTVK